MEITDEFDGEPAEEATPDTDAGDRSGSVGHAGESAEPTDQREEEQ